jgi:Protein of unknown function (DUF3300)
MINKDCVALILVFSMLLCSPGVISGAPPPSPQLKTLDQLLAPIALYPDALLAQVLACATSPQQVTDMNNWMRQNTQLQGTPLQDAANQQGFDASFVALALFPDVINMLATNIDWTTEVGTAFLSDQKGVMDSVQGLRAQAQTAGNLKTTPQQEVVTENKGGQQIIVIQPANPQVVYVPVYNPQTVYVAAPPAVSPTVAALMGFGLGIAIGASINNNYYYSPYGWGAWGMHWHTHVVVVRGGPWVVPRYGRYPYVRPVSVPYGGYRPRAAVYAPTNINVKVNRNVYAGSPTRPTPYTRTARPTTLPATISPTRPATLPSTRPTTAPGTRSPAPKPTNTPQRATQPSTPGKPDYGSRGYSQTASQVPSPTRTTERAQTSSGAFSGYQPGTAERAASQRGQSSVSSGQARTRGSAR